MDTEIPQEKVLYLAELLEMILLALPQVDIVKARDICRFFRQIIDRSHPLQQDLFLKAKSHSASLIVLEFRINYRTTGITSRPCWTIKPLLLGDRNHPYIIAGVPSGLIGRLLLLTSLKEAIINHHGQPNPKYKDMFLTDPPSTNMHVRVFLHRGDCGHYEIAKATNQAGVRLADVARAARSLLLEGDNETRMERIVVGAWDERDACFVSPVDAEMLMREGGMAREVLL